MDITATVWTLLPPIIAIALALITKEVYSSLLIGILAGALLYTGFNPLHAVETTFEIMGGKLGDNINICIFLVLLGILVSLVTKSGASRAYGEWAVKTIKSRRGASFATSFLGIFIFVDDYFNCLTVGTVMRPVTDKYSITRAKLAYIIDATAAPVCIIAPISSWAAAVGSSLPESSTMDGFSLFMKTIPMNLYAILTLIFLIWLMAADFDFAAMGKYAREHKDDDLSQLEENYVVGGAGKVYDLILPIAVLIVLCIGAMLYTGGILEGANIIDAFANCSSSTALVLGSFFTLVFTFLLYIPRKVLSFGQFCEAFTEGFKSMVPAILILTLAWTLSGVCSADYLNIGGFVSSIVSADSVISMLMPGDLLPHRARSRVRDRHELGHVRHPYPDRRRGIRRQRDHHARHDRCGLPVRRSLRRPHLSDLGHHDPGVRRRTVPPHRPRFHAASLCAARCGDELRRLPCRRRHRQRRDRSHCRSGPARAHHLRHLRQAQKGGELKSLRLLAAQQTQTALSCHRREPVV